MSLSEESELSTPGRVIMGLRSQSLSQDAFGGGRIAVWTEEAEAELLDRVRVKAREEAKAILAKAMVEAEELRKAAREQGFAQGVETVREEFAGKISLVLAGIDKGKKVIWQEHRSDIAILLKLAVERVMGIELSERREESLGKLLDEALDLIDAHRDLTIKVNPADVKLLEELLDRAKSKFPALERWRVKPDAGLNPGGVILESHDGVVDNSLTSRMQSVGAVLDLLALSDERA